MIVHKPVSDSDLEALAQAKNVLRKWKDARMAFPMEPDVTVYVRDADAKAVNEAMKVLEYMLTPTSQADAEEFNHE